MTAFLFGFLGGHVAGLISAPQVILITTSGLTGTATITSVNTANTIIRFSAYTSDISGFSMLDAGVHWVLTNATTITWTKISATPVSFALVVQEFTPGFITSQEMTSVSISSGGTSGTDAISSVNPAKYEIIPYGSTATSFTTAVETIMTLKWSLNSAIQVGLSIPATNSSTLIGYANVIQTG